MYVVDNIYFVRYYTVQMENIMNTLSTDARLDIRLNAHDKAIIDAAARLRGSKLSAFVRAAALRESQEILAAESVRLSPNESQRFLAALSMPFSPNEKLARALIKANAAD